MKPLFSFFCLYFLFVFTSTSQIQQGEASYYKDVFEGRKTASGEIFQQALPTAAHRSLPFGTIVKVTNTANSKSVEVSINDRGPFIRNRIIDVSKSVAETLGFVKEGVAIVELEVIEFGSKNKKNNIAEGAVGEVNATPNSNAKENEDVQLLTADIAQKLNSQIQKNPEAVHYFNLKAEPIRPNFLAVQLASFSDSANALKMGSTLEEIYQEEVSLVYKQLNEKGLYTLVVGKLSTRNQAEKLLQQVKNRYPDAFIVNLEN